MASLPFIEVAKLTKTFVSRGGLFRRRFEVKAVNDVSFSIGRGETLGLVGESGSGKTTVGRMVVQLERPDAGSVRFDGQELTTLAGAELRAVRKRMQIVFQDPYAALNPRMPVGEFVEEPLIIHGVGTAAERRDTVRQVFEMVGLDPNFTRRYPHEFSGGQRQRVGIARAIVLRPAFIVADEPITALDVSIQAQIVNLMQDLQEQLGLTYLLISHDLSMVRYLCQRVAVMYKGRIVETAPTQALYEDPIHPYTRILLSAVPVPNPTIERQRRRLVMDPRVDYAAGSGRLEEVRPGHLVAQFDPALRALS